MQAADRTRQSLLAGAFAVLGACGGGSGGGGGTDTTPPISCGEFPPWQESAYVLPFTVGERYVVNQGNCSGFGHSGFWEFGYDFRMPIGTVVTAARDGIVLHAQDGTEDGDRNGTNLITVRHDDGTVAVYSHLTLNGVQVTVGQSVAAGDPIGLSGDTGNTGGLPHLHFSVHPCGALPGLPGTGDCPSEPVNFRNTAANPTGLHTGNSYEALPF